MGRGQVTHSSVHQAVKPGFDLESQWASLYVTYYMGTFKIWPANNPP